jgi:aminopeptidase N
LHADAAPRAFRVEHYRVRIEPDIAARTVAGRVVLDVVVGEGAQENIELDSGDLAIDAVTERGSPVVFAAHDRRLTVEWLRPASPNQKRQIEITYHGSPRSGVQFAPDRSQVYTIFTTSQWMVCVNAPDERATMELAIVLPAGLAVVASGRQTAERTLASGAVLHEWRQDRPMPSYTYGFAAGHFTDVRDDRGGHRFRYLGDGFSAAELRRIFAIRPT